MTEASLIWNAVWHRRVSDYPQEGKHWRFQFFAHSECLSGYDPSFPVEFMTRDTPENETDGECGICSTMKAKERNGKRAALFKSRSIPRPQLVIEKLWEGYSKSPGGDWKEDQIRRTHSSCADQEVEQYLARHGDHEIKLAWSYTDDEYDCESCNTGPFHYCSPSCGHNAPVPLRLLWRVGDENGALFHLRCVSNSLDEEMVYAKDCFEPGMVCLKCGEPAKR